MKEKISILIGSLMVPLAALAQDDAPVDLPEPSTIALFVSAALAVLLAKKLKR